MAFIKVWCEYDIGGDFGGNNNEAIYFVENTATDDEIDQALIDMFSDLAEDVESESNLIEEGLMGWEIIDPSILKVKGE